MVKEEKSGRNPQWTANNNCDHFHKEQEESHTDQSQLNRLTKQSEGEANTFLKKKRTRGMIYP
ncbi:uncharacterized protein PHACADRAFT_202632 [Phanerochaete carnosa HHB-10118-sp]|uniref:Uncharacterized protein n=1 Tax=Phanerochaete carnosa (strain HHB-10118-sp) TaxID=650164 RepID=K5WEI1_PHACS|nr:uncharacterized protein PHACADRAFT_202632 [Phanerochaete carnosa HHB-10118-sp]EKM48587.1 hypothetical protein PHACADRAFT_202632 [Phanerochaete carnosa HHB-10118-sp]